MIADLHIDATGFIKAAGAFERAGKEAPNAIRRALNRAGDMTRTQVVRTLVVQTGLKHRTIDKAVKANRANFGSLTYTLRARGGDVRVQFFGAKEKGSGVEAHPWNKSIQYAGAFMRQGFTRRVPFTHPGMAGHVFKRVAGKRLPIAQQKSGLYIPEEMVKGASEAIFQSTVAAVLPGRLDHELSRILSG